MPGPWRMWARAPVSPGVVLALMRPDLDVHLVEPMERRVAWLSELRDELDLDNVTLHQVQAQELHGKLKVQAVTARAVAPLGKLARWTLPLLSRRGVLLAQKGARAQAELDEAAVDLRDFAVDTASVHDVDLLGDGETTRVVEVRLR